MLRLVVGSVLLVLSLASGVHAQTALREAEIKRLVPYRDMLAIDPTMTLNDYNEAVRALARKELQEAAPIYTPPPSTTWSRPSWAAPSSIPRTTYDWRSGNTYHTSPQPDGSTRVRGYNFNNGSTWTTMIEPDGDMRGYDKDMNLWKYDAESKRYYNFGTGTTCVGEGYARRCY
jgi:hypothetical protein